MGDPSLRDLLLTLERALRESVPYFMVSVLTGRGLESEMIIFPLSSYNHKLEFYAKAYAEDLTLKANPEVQIKEYKPVFNYRLIHNRFIK